MRITTTPFLGIQKTQKQLTQAFAKLASGKDTSNPATKALASGLESAVRELQQTNRNVSSEQSSLAIADGSLNSTRDDLQRLRELSLQASNGTLNGEQRAAIQTEANQLAEEINSRGDITTSIDLTTQSSAEDSIEQIDTALASVNTKSAEIGASQSALEFRSNANSVTIENLSEARSRAEDVDFAQLVSEVNALSIQQKFQIQTQSAQLANAASATALLTTKK